MNNIDLVHKYQFQKYIENKNLFVLDTLVAGKCSMIYYWILAVILINILWIYLSSTMTYIFIQGYSLYFIDLKGV